MKFRQWDVTVNKVEYGNNGRVALMLNDAFDGSRIAIATVNIPDEPLGPDEVFVKDWSENEGMLQFLQDNGIAEPTGDLVNAGYVVAKKCKLLGEWAT